MAPAGGAAVGGGDVAGGAEVTDGAEVEAGGGLAVGVGVEAWLQPASIKLTRMRVPIIVNINLRIDLLPFFNYNLQSLEF